MIYQRSGQLFAEAEKVIREALILLFVPSRQWEERPFLSKVPKGLTCLTKTGTN